MNNKSKIVSVILTLVLLCNVIPPAYAAATEQIQLNVQTLDPADYEETTQTFKMIDLTGHANRDFADGVEGDGKGGWSDQGDNDMRMYTDRGVVNYLDIPFTIIEPNDNGGKAVVGVRGKDDPGLPTRVEIPVNAKGAGAYFLHSSPHGVKNEASGKYSFVYDDGTSAYLDIICEQHINDFWSNSDTDHMRIVFTGENAEIDTASLSVFALSNPHPDKTIQNIVLETEGSGSYLMVVAITLTDKGPYLPSRVDANLNPNRRYWVEYEGANEELIKGSMIDFSNTLDAPAGKHGAVVAGGDTFKFADGSDAIFWGTNIVGDACFPDNATAKKVADMLARCGVNLVRFSGIDQFIFGENEYGVLDNDKANKLCRFVDILKEKGIYTYLAPISDERFVIKGFFVDELIELQKSYLGKLLKHKNPDTGVELGKNPAVIMLEFADSNSLFAVDSSKGIYGLTNPEDKAALDEKYNEFIKEKYGNDSVMKKRYGEGYGFNSDETIANGTMSFKVGWRAEIINPFVGIDMREFMADTQNKYYAEMNAVVEQCGSNVLTTGNSNPAHENVTGDAYSNSKTDFVARNALWARPATKIKELKNGILTGVRTSMTLDSNAGFFGNLAGTRISGTPYVVSGYGTALINPYQAEPIVMMAGIAGQQKWTPIQYSFIYNEIPETAVLNDFYSMYYDPARIAVLSACSELYRSMEKPNASMAKMSVDSIFLGNDSNVLNLGERLSNYSGIEETTARESQKHLFEDKVVKNDGIYLDSANGFFAAQSKTSSAITVSKAMSVKLEKFDFTAQNNHATVVLTAKDGKEVEKSESLLLTAVGRTLNADMKLDVLNQILEKGKTPVYVEPVDGRIVLKTDGEYTVYSLDINGQRMAEVPVFKTNEGTVIKLSRDNKCIYYELVKK